MESNPSPSRTRPSRPRAGLIAVALLVAIGAISTILRTAHPRWTPECPQLEADPWHQVQIDDKRVEGEWIAGAQELRLMSREFALDIGNRHSMLDGFSIYAIANGQIAPHPIGFPRSILSCQWTDSTGIHFITNDKRTGAGTLVTFDPVTWSERARIGLEPPPLTNGHSIFATFWTHVATFPDGSAALTCAARDFAHPPGPREKYAVTLVRTDGEETTMTSAPDPMSFTGEISDWGIDDHRVLGRIKYRKVPNSTPAIIDWDSGAITRLAAGDPLIDAFAGSVSGNGSMPPPATSRQLTQAGVFDCQTFGRHPMMITLETKSPGRAYLWWTRIPIISRWLLQIPSLQHQASLSLQNHNLVAITGAHWQSTGLPEPVPPTLLHGIRAAFDVWPDPGVRLYALDDSTVLLTQMVPPSLSGSVVSRSLGLIRFGLLHPPDTAITWAGWIPLPPMPNEFSNAPDTRLYASGDTWLLGCRYPVRGPSQSGRGAVGYAWSAIPRPEGAPVVNGWLTHRALTPPMALDEG
ncbi:MAG: hypothetical protein ABI743_00510 [bacterium]